MKLDDFPLSPALRARLNALVEEGMDPRDARLLILENDDVIIEEPPPPRPPPPARMARAARRR